MAASRRARSNPKQIGNVLEKLFRDLGLNRRLKQYDVLTQWGEIVGETLARVSEAKRIDNGILFVRVKSSAWRNELALRKREIIKKICSRTPRGTIKDIRFQ